MPGVFGCQQRRMEPGIVNQQQQQITVWLVAFWFLFAIVILWIPAQPEAQTVADTAELATRPRYTINLRGNSSFSQDRDTFPCTLLEAAYPAIWLDDSYADNNNRYDMLIIDWYLQAEWKVYTHAERDFALVWNDNADAHPDGAWFVDCDF